MSKRDLLRKLRSVRSAERELVPDQAWVLRTRSRLMDQARRADALAPLPTSPRFREVARAFVPMQLVRFMRTPVLAALSVLVAVLGGSLVSVSASERSVPGDFLYPIKIAGEQTRLAFTQGKADRVRLKADFVDRRVEEIKTIVKTQEKENPERLREAARGLKRDLDTVKNQLKEVRQESSSSETAELAKLVDERTEQVTQELKQVQMDALPEAKSAVAEAEAQAVQTGVAAMAVLIEARTQPDAQDIITDEEVTSVLEGKLQALQASIIWTTERLRLANASGTDVNASATGTLLDALSFSASTTAPQLASASATLSEVTILLSEHKLDEAAAKLAEAAKATAQAVAASELFVASSTNMLTLPPESVPGLSTTSSAPSASSTSIIPTTDTTTTQPRL